MGLLGLYPQKASSSENDQWERSGTQKFVAFFTTDCDEVYARTHLGTLINDPHPSDAGQVVADITVSQWEEITAFYDPTNLSNTDNGTPCYGFDVDIIYSPWDPLTHTATGDPADQPIDVAFDWQVFEQAVDIAYDPSTSSYVQVVNSAGDPFDPPVTREQLKGILRVAWNSHTFSPASFFAYGNCINADIWNGFPIGSIKFCPPKMPQRLYSQFLAANYYRLEAEFAFNPNDGGWNAKPIDRGYRALDGSGHPYKIFDINGQPISSPALLDGSGVPLPPTGAYYQFNYQIYNSITFATTFPNLTTLF
jgi:hypothetical protein